MSGRCCMQASPKEPWHGAGGDSVECPALMPQTIVVDLPHLSRSGGDRGGADSGDLGRLRRAKNGDHLWERWNSGGGFAFWNRRYNTFSLDNNFCSNRSIHILQLLAIRRHIHDRSCPTYPVLLVRLPMACLMASQTINHCSLRVTALQ